MTVEPPVELPGLETTLAAKFTVLEGVSVVILESHSTSPETSRDPVSGSPLETNGVREFTVPLDGLEKGVVPPWRAWRLCVSPPAK
jgi:hypothetical protein